MELTVDTTPRAQAINLLELAPAPLTVMTAAQQRRWQKTGKLVCPDGTEPGQIEVIHLHDYSLRALVVDMDANTLPRGDRDDQIPAQTLPVYAERHLGGEDFLFVVLYWGDEDDMQMQAMLPPDGLGLVLADEIEDLDIQDDDEDGEE